MVSNAFKSAYSNKVNAQNQTVNTVTNGIKEGISAIIGATAFGGGLGDGIVAEAGKNLFANQVGGLAGNIMLANLKAKKQTAEAQRTFTTSEVNNTIADTLGNNPINRSAKNSLTTVFEKLANKQGDKK